ncbi:hypothetical protein GCM10017687_47400 [Streptomyces echinatus]
MLTAASRTRRSASRTASSNRSGWPGGSGTYPAMSCSWQTTSWRSDSVNGRAIDAGTGVTSPTQWLERPGVRTGTGTMSRRGSPATRAYRIIMSRYVRMSGPPMSKQRLTSSGRRAQPTRRRRTSRTAIGWIRVRTQLGVTITGSRSVRYRSISKDTDPEPMMTAARRTAVGTPEASRMRPTSARDLRCGESRSPGTPAGVRPPR